VSPLLLVGAILVGIVLASMLLDMGTRWWAQRKQRQLRVTSEARDYLRRRTNGQRRAQEEHDSRQAKREG